MKQWIIKYHKVGFDGYIYDFEDVVIAKNIPEAIQMWLNVGYEEREDGTIYRPEHKAEWVYCVVEKDWK